MKPAPCISWFVERQGVTVYGRNGEISLSIPYPYAGLWALVANGNYTPSAAANLMSVLLDASPDEARRSVAETLASWTELGLISGD
jgi:hypothetical protein